MKEIQSSYMPDQHQNHTVKSFCSTCFHDCNPGPGTRCLARHSFLRSSQSATNHSDKRNVSRIHQISEWQEVGTESGVLFCLYISRPFSWWLLLIWHIHSVLTRTILRQLSSFYKHKTKAHCYEQLPQNTITSLCKLHPPHHYGRSPSFLPQCAF